MFMTFLPRDAFPLNLAPLTRNSSDMDKLLRPDGLSTVESSASSSSPSSSSFVRRQTRRDAGHIRHLFFFGLGRAVGSSHNGWTSTKTTTNGSNAQSRWTTGMGVLYSPCMSCLLLPAWSSRSSILSVWRTHMRGKDWLAGHPLMYALFFFCLLYLYK